MHACIHGNAHICFALGLSLHVNAHIIRLRLRLMSRDGSEDMADTVAFILRFSQNVLLCNATVQ